MVDLDTWNAAIRTVVALIQPKPLKADADSFDRLAHNIGVSTTNAVRTLLDHPEFAAVAVTSEQMSADEAYDREAFESEFLDGPEQEREDAE